MPITKIHYEHNLCSYGKKLKSKNKFFKCKSKLLSGVTCYYCLQNNIASENFANPKLILESFNLRNALDALINEAIKTFPNKIRAAKALGVPVYRIRPCKLKGKKKSFSMR